MLLEGVVKFEKERAAERTARKEAVRLDLKEVAIRGAECRLSGGPISISFCSAVSWTCCAGGGNSGWSKTQSFPLDVERLFLPPRLPASIAGVAGSLAEQMESSSSSRDGIDSVDTDRTDEEGPMVVSLSKLPLSISSSSGGLNRKSQV